MNSSDLQRIPHRRFNPLTHEWVLVSPHRTERPWVGKVEKPALANRLEYDPECYLCPGNRRAGEARNPSYEKILVFDNDYPAMRPDCEPQQWEEGGLLVGRTEPGICRVMCFSPRHDLTIPRMSSQQLRAVVDGWVEEYSALGATPWIRYVQIFENHGELTGASNPHPHCQIWANASLPNLPARELQSFRDFRVERQSCLLCDYSQLELQLKQRVVCQNDAFVVVVPYWAVWPFETLVLSKRHIGSIDQLMEEELDLLGDILRRITVRYDNLFETPFPYSMGFHQKPTDGGAYDEWHFHAHYFPPLLRSATIQKFMVGYELLGSPQRDLTPENASKRLVEAGETHYLERS
jgi:UDPglucose--hexose-1-phosphate uridylyltransferase